MLMKLLNKKQLAAELGVSRDYVTAMCRNGFRMPGGRATVAEALGWRKTAPDFQVRQRAPRQGGQDPQGAGADTRHARDQTSGRRIASFAPR